MTSQEAEVGLWMVLLGADGAVSDEELSMLHEMARKRFGEEVEPGELSVDVTMAQMRIESIGAPAFLAELSAALPREAAAEVLGAAVAIARSDSLASEERQLLVQVGSALGLDEAQVVRIIG